MFKLESFMTPLILSYVQKYVKNVHPKDSQLSLWDGEAVFNNLDLRLEVLEQELQMPFTFINGHVHELRISIPWTKLGSESIVITVNTFECILKLKDETDIESEIVETPTEETSKAKRKVQRVDAEDAPPSYIQSLITRITNNFTIICNNVILKYVEDDIVLSVNVKSAQFHSANEKWEKAYIDLTPTDLATRKLINLIDITICLDQRGSNGKIETYQEPLLYKSSIEGRLYIAYDSMSAKSPTTTRCDFRCDQIDLSVSDQQLPMILRLLQLCLALYFGDIVITPTKRENDSDPLELPSTESDDEQTWGSWAWSLLPQVNSMWEDEEDNNDEDALAVLQSAFPVVHFSVHLLKLSITCKLTEASLNQKISFRPFARINLEGVFVDAVVRHPDCANIQIGVNGISAVNLIDCVCAGSFLLSDTCQEPILITAGQFGNGEKNYLHQTLFDALSPENRKQRRDYNYQWEEHFADLTESKLLQRSSAAAIDYFYYLTLPEDQPDDVSTCSFSDLEDTNFKERLKVRVIIGPCEVNLTGAFVHCSQKFIVCAFNREFGPYPNSKTDSHGESRHAMPTAEDIALMEEFIPFKNYVLIIVQPTLRFFACDHPSCEIDALPVQQRKKRKQNSSLKFEDDLLNRPVIVAQINRIEIQQIVPMYAKRVVKVACTMSPISDHFLYNSQSHMSIKMFSLEVNLAIMKDNKCENSINIIPPFSAAYFLKELQHPTMWNNPFQPKIEQFVEMARFTIHLTWAQTLLISSILNSWYKPSVEKMKFLQTPLTRDAISVDNDFSLLDFSVTGIQCKYSMNDAVHSAIAWMSTCRLSLQYWKNDAFNSVTIFHGPEEKENVYSIDSFKELVQSPTVDFLLASDQCVKLVIQFPKSMNTCSAPTVLLLSVKGLSLCLDPTLYDWLNYFPNVPAPSSVVVSLEAPIKDDLTEVPLKGSAPSSSAPPLTESQSQLNQRDSDNPQFAVSIEKITEFGLNLFTLSKRLLLEIHVETCSIFLPTDSVSISPNSTNIIRGMRKMFSTRTIPDTLVVNLPQVNIYSGTQKQNLHSSIDDIPIYTLEGLNLSQDLFPWTLTLTNFSIYTVNSKREAVYILNPLHSSATIALSSETTPADKISKINLCVHADTKSVHIKFTDKQVKVISIIAQHSLNAISKALDRAISAVNLFAVSINESKDELQGNLDKSATSASQVEVMSSTVLENNLPVVDQGKQQLTETPKISIWIQWTLPKLTVDLCWNYAYLLSLDFEELVLSFDVQDVYSKIKLKLTSFNWNHYQKTDLSLQWTPGPFKGIFFSCSDKLNKTVAVANPKSESNDRLNTGNLFESSASKTAYNFLTVTFTRALSKNVQRRWTQLLREHNDQFNSKLTDPQPEQERFVSEIDVKMRSFDCVFWCPVLVKGFEILEPLFHLELPFLKHANLDTFTKIDKDSSKYHLQLFNNNKLPLLYVSASSIRVFVPKEIKEHAENKHDMCIFQIEKISIVSQVDNPLSRIILRPDLYSLAQQARIIYVPGSEVEDRQYQMDITGISLSNGSWKELVKRSSVNEQPTASSLLRTMGENPALEWNNKSVVKTNDTDSDTDLIFFPLVAPFNTRILAAPAIVYEQKTALKKREDILVAGHSFEINIASDFDVYLNMNQLTLLFDILQDNIWEFNRVFPHQIMKTDKNQSDDDYLLSEIIISSSSEPVDSGIEVRLDSGIESDMSTIHKDNSLMSSPVVALAPPADVIIEQQEMLNQSFTQDWNPENIVPFEMLFTARRFTFTTYADKLIRNESRIKETKKTSPSGSKKRRLKHKSNHSIGKFSDLEWKNKNSQLRGNEVEISSLHDGYDGSEEDSVEENSEFGNKTVNDSRMYPILYLMVSQPHAFLNCRFSTSKLEISCFDVIVKGSNDKSFIPVQDDKFVPNMNDYPIPWLETKPGDIDIKTGIPPALMTITVSNFLTEPANIKMSFDRPLKLNLSLLKYEQLLDYGQEIVSATIGSIKSKIVNTENIKSLTSTRNVQDLMESVRSYATYIRFIHFATVQLVVVFETVPHEENIFLVLSWDDVNATVELKKGKLDLIDEIILGLAIENFTLKTSCNNHLRLLLQPTCASLTSNAVWNVWNKSSVLPHICINIEVETTSVYIGNDTYVCYNKILEHITQFLKSSTPTSANEEPASKSFERRKSETEMQEQVWHDDLRVGRFQYIQDSDDTGLQPEPNEIVFCREQVGQSASMTWCYEEPRALTRVEIYPVPFRTASDAGIQGVADKEEVGCVLQYWNPLTRCYVTCRHFNLSETQHCNLNLPRVCYGDTKQKLFISRRWRVLLDYYDKNEEESQEPIIRRSLVSPLALAACMRVDSYFNPNLIPTIQARLAIELLHVNFTNQFQDNAKGIPIILNPFVFDGVMPRDQEFLTFIFQNADSSVYSWEKWSKFEVSSVVSADVLEYRSLTMRSYIEPCCGNLQFVLTEKENLPPIQDLSIYFGPFVLRFSQSLFHTVDTAITMFFQRNQDKPAQNQLTKEISPPLMNYYVICNDTQETIRFGQVGTDENIVLQSRQMHFYSWRSHRTKQIIHVCVEGMHWKWCEPFSIDKKGFQTRLMEQKGQRVILIIKVKEINQLQKQVIICGQLVFANRLNQQLEVKLTPVFHVTEDNKLGGEQNFIINQQSPAATCISEPGTRKAFRVRFPGLLWSKEIYFPQKSLVIDSTLIEVPLRDDQFFKFWCHFFVESFGSTCQMLVLFVPVYIIQTHLSYPVNLILTTPGLGQVHSVQIDGFGQEFQLHCPGGTEITHQMAFQLRPDMPTSQPSLPLSVNMISQVTKLPYPENINIEEISTSWMSNNALLWPYDDKEYRKKVKGLPPGLAEYFLKSRKRQLKKISSVQDQPNIDLEVCLAQRWPACNTLLIDVKPWALITNRSSVNMILRNSDDVEWNLIDGETFPCPKLREYVKLGIEFDGDIHYSEKLQLTAEDWTFRRYLPKIGTSLPETGSTRFDIKIKGDNHAMLCALTVTTNVHNGIRIIQIQSAFNIVNNVESEFRIVAATTPATDEKVEYSPHTSYNILLKAKDESSLNSFQSLLFWEAFQPEVIYYNRDEEDNVKYVGLRFSEGSNNFENWSLPCRIQTSTNLSRQTVAIPALDVDLMHCELPLVTRSYVITAHELDAITYLVLSEDTTPQMIIHNFCPVALHFGQSSLHSGNTVMEESEVLNCVPLVASMTACHYSLPYISKNFPNIQSPETVPKLHFAKSYSADSDDGEEFFGLNWSSGIDSMCEGDLFLNIPNYSDVRIHTENVAHVMYLFLEPVSRIEVSAKEIRGRIQSEERGLSEHRILINRDSVKPKKRSFGSTKTNKTNKVSEVDSKVPGTASRSQSLPKKQDTQLFYYAVYSKQLCIIVMDELIDVERPKEILRLTADDFVISQRPKVEVFSNKRVKTRIMEEMLCCFTNVQFDNQMSNEGNYDYSVVVIPRRHSPSHLNIDDSVPFEILLQAVRNNAVAALEMVTELVDNVTVPGYQRVNLTIKPLVFYIEDTFYYKFFDLIKSYQSVSVTNVKWQNIIPRTGRLPVRSVIMSSLYQSPYIIEEFTIEPTEVVISIHATIKICISLVETPLVFKKFERCKLFTTNDRVGNALVMHYLSAALFRAGWVVGSIDLIGNPGGFARAVGSGMSDFVRMPYQGFFRGPWAFISGIAYGSSSLVRHISGGSIFSMTNLASSVSRNMERLSLDEEYRLQNEESRRHKPDNITEGLSQGLTGFGISLLGAIAGIVDQPIQSIQKAVDQDRFPPTAAVTGLISGVSKGLVGIVAKPVGGAAEFFAQAGQGILYGTGWSQVLKPKFEAATELIENNRNSRVKYLWKMLTLLPDSEIITAIEATQFNQTGHYVPCVLLLTSQMLFLVNINEDTQQQAFFLSEIDCHGLSSDPTLIYLIPVQKTNNKDAQSDERVQDRVVDYVSKSTKYAGVYQGTTDESESQSDSSVRTTPPPEQLASSLKFFVNPPLRNTFVSLFNSVKNRFLGNGFPNVMQHHYPLFMG